MTEKLRAGIIGWPVTHSLSPVLHGYWLKQYGIDGEMLRVPAKPEEFADVIARLRAEDFRGVNVTVPHKEAAFSLAHRLDTAANSAGAANLLVFHVNEIEGRNTDALGLAESLRESIGTLNNKSAVLLGAGGAARAAVLALEMLGASSIFVLARDITRSNALAESLAPHVKAFMQGGGWRDWEEVAGIAALVVNCTSAGMGTNAPPAVDLGVLSRDAVVCDIVYNPLQTELLKDAAARGHKTIDGLGMLMHQAAPSFEAFFGVRPKVTPSLRAELERVLRERQ